MNTHESWRDVISDALYDAGAPDLTQDQLDMVASIVMRAAEYVGEHQGPVPSPRQPSKPTGLAPHEVHIDGLRLWLAQQWCENPDNVYFKNGQFLVKRH